MKTPAGAVAGWLTGLATGALVLCLGLGDVLATRGQAALAARLPGNADAPARLLLPPAAEGPNDAALHRLALAALGNSPLSSEALVYLAGEARRGGDSARAAALLSVAARTGWHDEAAQRQLFNAALRAGEPERALDHAEGLLRQGKARDELFASFDGAVAVPAFRKAFAARMASDHAWPKAYLLGHGARLSDTILLELLTARAARPGGLDRPVVATLAPQLAKAGRLDMLARAWRLNGQADGIGPGPLPWRGNDESGPFDWNADLAYGGEEGWLVAPTEPGTPPATRLIALPPGVWRLTAGDGHGWLWSVTCGANLEWPTRRVGSDTDFAVAADCPVQTVAVVPGGEALPGESRLPPLRIERRP